MTMPELHTDLEYERELTTLRARLLTMGSRSESMILTSMRAFADGNLDLARSTIDSDSEVDQLEMEVDERCLRLLALRQPMAGDLRFITTALRLVIDLERIGDLGVNICERTIELGPEPPLPINTSVQGVADAALGMLRDVFDAFETADVVKAAEVLGRDDLVDALYAQLLKEVVQFTMKNPQEAFRATRVQSIGKYLERIADHATNIAEMVVFIAIGHDVRHPDSAGGH
jgi:phosphate transport system protein